MQIKPQGDNTSHSRMAINKKTDKTSIREDVETLGSFHTVHEIVQWYSHFGTEFGS